METRKYHISDHFTFKESEYKHQADSWSPARGPATEQSAAWHTHKSLAKWSEEYYQLAPEPATLTPLCTEKIISEMSSTKEIPLKAH